MRSTARIVAGSYISELTFSGFQAGALVHFLAMGGGAGGAIDRALIILLQEIHAVCS